MHRFPMQAWVNMMCTIYLYDGAAPGGPTAHAGGLLTFICCATTPCRYLLSCVQYAAVCGPQDTLQSGIPLTCRTVAHTNAHQSFLLHNYAVQLRSCRVQCRKQLYDVEQQYFWLYPDQPEIGDRSLYHRLVNFERCATMPCHHVMQLQSRQVWDVPCRKMNTVVTFQQQGAQALVPKACWYYMTHSLRHAILSYN